MRLASYLAITAITASALLAEETKPGSKVAPASAADKSAAANYDGPTVAAFQVLRYQTKTSLSTLTKFLKDHESELQAMNDRERDEFFAKHLKLAEANTLPVAGSSAFATAAQSKPSQESSPGKDKRAQRGPPPEVRAKYEKLSDQAKEKLRKIFSENREKLGKMNEEERRKFMDSSFKKIAEEDVKSQSKGDAKKANKVK